MSAGSFFSLAAMGLGCLLLTGCRSTTIIDKDRLMPAHVKGKDSVVVLGRRFNSHYETEHDFIECVGNALERGKEPINIIPEKRFVDAVYPYFEASTAPADVKNLQKLVEIPPVAQKFKELSLRYFVWIDGFTETTDKEGSIFCAPVPGIGAGCFGSVYWDDEAKYEARIWDLDHLSLASKIGAETQGTSSVSAFIIPIPVLVRVQANACRSMAEQIRSFLK